jgi:hypothetical protein
MQQSDAQHLLRILGPSWVLLAWAGGLFLYFSRNAALKRRLLLPVVIAVYGPITGLAALAGAPVWFLCVAGAASILIGTLAFRVTGFCDTCGGLMKVGSGPAKLCPACRARMKQ